MCGSRDGYWVTYRVQVFDEPDRVYRVVDWTYGLDVFIEVHLPITSFHKTILERVVVVVVKVVHYKLHTGNITKTMLLIQCQKSMRQLLKRLEMVHQSISSSDVLFHLFMIL